MKKITFSESEINELKGFYELELDKAKKRYEEIEILLQKIAGEEPGTAVNSKVSDKKAGAKRGPKAGVAPLKSKKDKKGKGSSKKKKAEASVAAPEVIEIAPEVVEIAPEIVLEPTQLAVITPKKRNRPNKKATPKKAVKPAKKVVKKEVVAVNTELEAVAEPSAELINTEVVETVKVANPKPKKKISPAKPRKK